MVLVDLEETAILDEMWCPNYKCPESYGTASTWSPCAVRRSRCSYCCRRLITPIVIVVLVAISGVPRWWSGTKSHTWYEHIYYLVPRNWYIWCDISPYAMYIPRATSVPVYFMFSSVYIRGADPPISICSIIHIRWREYRCYLPGTF